MHYLFLRPFNDAFSTENVHIQLQRKITEDQVEI